MPPPLPRKPGTIPPPSTGVPDANAVSTLSQSWSAPVTIEASTAASGDPTVVNRDSAPALPPPPMPATAAPAAPVPAPTVPVPNTSAAELINALSPSPAAQRRETPPLDAPIIGDRRGANPVPTTGNPAPGDVQARAKRASVPPPTPTPIGGARPKTPSVPPPTPTAASTTTPAVPSAPTTMPATAATLPSVAQTVNPVPLEIASTRAASDGVEPPPTRIHRSEAQVDRPFTPPKVNTIPEIPEPGLVNAARYAYEFAIAKWQRRGAIKQLGIEIKQDTEALDQVLGALGRAARTAKVEGRVFSAENAAITAAEERIAALQREASEVEGRKAEENSKFGDIERERNEKLVDAERMVEEAQRELQHLEAQRRSLRDTRKELERRQKAYLKNAEEQERQAGAAPLGDARQEFRRTAEGHRKEAAALEPDKQDVDRRLTSLERPMSEAQARLDAAKAELDAAKRSLNDAREGHGHRLAELDAEHKRKAREINLAEAEIARRLVTLGTLVNLNRVEDASFAELYQRIDRLRGAITARTTEIEKLTAEREAYDRGTWVRGVATIGGACLALIALIVILRAVL
jgi:hypothetical protein